MTSATEIGREPITIVELTQPRCANRFGTSPCTASGTPRCYNTYSTCLDTDNYDGTGSIKWRFIEDRPGVLDYGDYSDADNPETNAIPCLVSVTTSESKINPGANLSGKSPFGVTSTVTVTLQDFEWNDFVGDYEVASRSGVTSGQPYPVRGNFWALWAARNVFWGGMTLTIYDGYVGQALSAMRSRVYIFQRIDGPDAKGTVTLTGRDPLRLASSGSAEFPRTSDLELTGDIDASTTTIQVIGNEDDLSDTFGNASSSYLRINDEIVEFTGYTDDGDEKFTLTGAVRAALGTTASAHDEDDKAQRVGRYEAQSPWLVVNDLIANHTEIDSAYIPLSDWSDEGGTYLPSATTTTTIAEPEAVESLIAQVCQQFLIYLWWAEYDQEIKMLAVRAPSGTPETLTDDNNILDGARISTDPDASLTRVVVYYELIDPLGDLESSANYARAYVSVDAEAETVSGSVSQKVIYGRWVQARSQAARAAVRLLARYKRTPKFLHLKVDAKDREVVAGDVCDVTTAALVDTEGNSLETRFQVISSKESAAGSTYDLTLQTYEFIGRFAVYMANGSSDYASTATADREPAGFFANSSGEMPGGDEGYLFQ